MDSASPRPRGCRAPIASRMPSGLCPKMADGKEPGHTQFTRMRSPAYSTAATRVRLITPAFDAPYGAAYGHAVTPATDAVLMMLPPPRPRIAPTAALIPLNVPMRWTSIDRRQSSTERLWILAFGDRTPALFT